MIGLLRYAGLSRARHPAQVGGLGQSGLIPKCRNDVGREYEVYFKIVFWLSTPRLDTSISAVRA